jgi:hypothetical protein
MRPELLVAPVFFSDNDHGEFAGDARCSSLDELIRCLERIKFDERVLQTRPMIPTITSI